jgi:alkanesulfonate monooxygenase SsuD/methylene tetrahydromethanopterin reductase-like flavin-dependent oxidoreductase (luciferase family)
MSLRPLGVALTPLENRREVVVRVAECAEELGYDSFFLAEGWGHDASVLLAEVATRTRRIRIGTGVVTTWGRSAAGLAMMASSLAAVSGDRFTLGLGAGSPSLAEGLHDLPFVAPIDRLRTVTSEVRRLLDGERATAVPGSRPLRLAARPDTAVPLYLAALGPRAVELCGEVSDGWIPFLLPLSGVPEGLRLLRAGAARRTDGRPSPLVCPALPLAVSSDAAQARAIAAWWVVFYLVSMGPLYRESLVRVGLGDAVRDVLEANPDPRTPVVSSTVLLDELVLWGDPSRARAALDSWYDAGADLPTLTLPPGRELAELEEMLEVMRPSSRT